MESHTVELLRRTRPAVERIPNYQVRVWVSGAHNESIHLEVISCIRRVSVTALVNSRQRGKPSPVTLRSDEITLDDFAFVATAAGVDTQNESESSV